MTPTEIQRTFFDLNESDLDDAENASLIRRLGFGKTADWDDVLKSRIIILMSEAQSGKTYECQTRQKALWNAGEPAFYIELSSVASQPWRELRSPEETERLELWRRTDSAIATIFLDSLDELRLTQGKFRAALRNVANDLDGHMARVRVVLTSRPLPVDRDLFLGLFAVPKSPRPLSAEAFAMLAMGESRQSRKEDVPPEVRFVSLVPLSTADVSKLAVARGVRDSDAFLNGLETSSMLEFMRRPQDVIEAASAWRELGGEFGTHASQVAFDVKARLKRSALRPDRELEDDRALDGARRLALAVVLTQRLTIRHDVNHDVGDASTVVDPTVVLRDWRDDDRKALLERGLFSFASYGRVRFHNRLAFEFLAAWRLAELANAGMSRKTVRRLLVVQTAQGVDVVRPSLRDVAGWLALRLQWVFELVNDLDPALLMNLGDPGSLSVEQRRMVLSSYIERYGTGGWRGLSVPQIQIQRFADASLEEIIRAQFDAIENPEVRGTLLALIGRARMHRSAEIARRVVWSVEADRDERIDALDALSALQDSDLTNIVDSLRCGPGIWNQAFAQAVIQRLFPQHMSVGQLLAILSWVQEVRTDTTALSRRLPRQIEVLTVEQLEELCIGLTRLVEEGLAFEGNTQAARNQRPHLVYLLVSTCARLLDARSLTPAHAYSIVLAAELTRGIRTDSSASSKLSQLVASVPLSIKPAIFEASVVLQRKLRPTRPRLDLFMQLAWRGSEILRLEDRAWLRDLLVDPSQSDDLRAAALLMDVFALGSGPEDRRAHIADLRPFVSGDSELAAFLEGQLKPSDQSRTHKTWAAANARRERRLKRRRAKDKASWVAFWRELKDDPDAAFGIERAPNTAWNLWLVLERGGAQGGSSGWHRQLIEEHLGRDVADRLRSALMPLWRRETPLLPSERPENERNTYYRRWSLAVAAITAEAEDTDWVAHLTADEVEAAIRYVPLSIQGFPVWLEALARAHPMAVERVLGGEVGKVLCWPAKANARSSMLQNIQYATPEVATLMLPALRSWLQTTRGLPGAADDIDGAAEKLGQVFDILLKFSNDIDRQAVGTLASAYLATTTNNESLMRVSLQALFAAEPDKAVSQLEMLCSGVEIDRESTAVVWIARLFGGLSRGHGVELRRPEMTSALLLRLLRLAYHHVERGADAVHVGGYSPDTRDDAENGRNVLLNAVIGLDGQDGWDAKHEIANDPKFRHLRDRLHALALEASAREADSAAMQPDEVAGLDAKKEPGPRSSAEMFSLIVDRLDDLADHLLADASPREMWSSVVDERVMRRAIAEHLETRACGAYSIAQEGVTSDEKETDIRIRSSVNGVEGVIELKIGDKPFYSGASLRSVISEQLVRKYLAPPSRRAGCLLITRSQRESWQHPDTGKQLDFSGLIAMLRAAAKCLQKNFPGEIHIDVIGLDLRARLSVERGGKSR
jgi:hypothetical protein